MSTDGATGSITEDSIRLEAAVNAGMHYYGYSDDQIFHPSPALSEELTQEEQMARIHLNAAELVDAENSIVRLEVSDSFTQDLIVLLGELASNVSLDDEDMIEQVKEFIIARSEEPAGL